MKLTVIFGLLIVTQAFAVKTYSQKTTLNLNMENASIKEILKEIEDKSEFYFLYNDDLINVSRKMSIKVTNMKVQDILYQLFAGQDINYLIKDRQIVLSPLPFTDDTVSGSTQVENNITGKVTDSRGLSLPGVTIQVKGTKLGTITDDVGKFTLNNVSANATLIFSFVGMKTREIALENKSTVNVVMVEESIGIDEVVAIGYGTQSKAMLSTAISSVSSEKLSDIPVTNAALAMVGQIAGIRFQQAEGAPGSSPYIRIRGNGSLTSNNGPLYVIDGYPTDDASLFNAILPNDILSIDVLKDAASAAIYGSRAGNGVIQVTTKSGKAGKTKFTFNSTTGIQQVSKRYDMCGPELFVEICKESRTNMGLPIPDFLNQPERWANTDWQDVIFRNAAYQNYELGASGGNEKMDFNISLGYLNNQGVVLNSFESRYSLRVSFNARLTEKLKVGVNIAPTYSANREQSTSGGNTDSGVGGILADAVSNVPIVPVWKENGDYFVMFQNDEMKGIFNTAITNPLNKLDANLNYSYAFRQVANAYLSFEPIKRLILKSTINTGLTNSRKEMYREAFLAKGNGNTGNISTPNLAQITASRSNNTKIDWYWSNTAAYDFKINEKHQFNALVGYDVSNVMNYSLSITPRTDVDNPVAFINTSIKNISGAVLTTGTSSKSEYVLDAFFGRLNYSFDHKYLFSGSLRRDRSSRFGPKNRAEIFPSLSAAWNVSKESFWDRINFVSTAKVRLSYGETGNDRLSGSYPWLTTLNMNYYNFGTTDTRVLTYAPTGFSNADLGWEKNVQFDGGVDLGFLRNRINLNVDVYERNSNTIISASIPTINGKASSALQNIGNVRNRGIEITFNSKNFVRNFIWQTDFNISVNKNKITELNKNATVFGSASSYIRNYLGRPMSDIYAYKIIGTFNNEQDLKTYAKFGSQGVGDLRFEDVLVDGKIDANDMTLLGNAQPKFTYGMCNSFQYRNFDLNIILDGSYGGHIVNQFERAISLLRYLENTIESVAKNRWKSEEDPGNGKTPRAGSKYLSSNITTNSRFVYSTSFLRIRNVTFGYTIPAPALKKIGIKNLRVFMTGTNLYTFTKYPGWNPEGNSNGDDATADGYDMGAYPLARNISIGVNLGF